MFIVTNVTVNTFMVTSIAVTMFIVTNVAVNIFMATNIAVNMLHKMIGQELNISDFLYVLTNNFKIKNA